MEWHWIRIQLGLFLWFAIVSVSVGMWRDIPATHHADTHRDQYKNDNKMVNELYQFTEYLLLTCWVCMHHTNTANLKHLEIF